MGQFSVEKSDPNGSDLNGNQQPVAMPSARPERRRAQPRSACLTQLGTEKARRIARSLEMGLIPLDLTKRA